MKQHLLILGLMACAISSCSNDSDTPEQQNEFVPIELSAQQFRAAENANSLGWKMFNTVVNNSDGTNIAMSPMSAAQTMYILVNGAASTTLDELLDALDAKDIDVENFNSMAKNINDRLTTIDKTATVKLCNSFWLTSDIVKSDFTQRISDTYGADIFYSNRERIVDDANKWAEESTDGIINKIMSQPYDIAIANVLYFRGIWKEKFDVTHTHKGRFHNHDGNTAIVDFMENTINNVTYTKNDLYTAVSLPFGNGAFTFDIILPEKDKNTSDCTAEILTAGGTVFRQNSLTNLKITLPKFDIKSSIDLIPVLKELGINQLFDYKCDLSEMLIPESNDFAILDYRQATSIKIDEEGAIAASATIGNGEILAPAPALILNVDRPFIFSIRETSSSAVLFLGKIDKL